MVKRSKMAAKEKQTPKKTGKKSRSSWFQPIFFAVGVVVFTTVQYALGYWLPSAGMLQAFCGTVAAHVALLSRIFDPNLVRSAAIITSSGFSIEVVYECTGAFTMFILNAMILSWPASWQRKLLGIVGGCAVLYLLNLLRMATLVYVGGHYSSEFFDSFHKYFWQATFIAVVLLVWFVWLEWFSGRARKD